MEKLFKISKFSLILKYAFRDLIRSYRKIFSIVLTLFISLFILSAILTVEDSLKKELNDNAKSLLGGDVGIDYNRIQGNLDLVDKVREFATISSMVEFTTMISATKDRNLSLFTRIKTVDKKYPLYGKIVHEPIDAMDRIHQEKNTIIVNENIFKTLDLKLNEKIKVQGQLFTVVGVVKSLPDVSGFVAFGDFAITSRKTLELLKLNSLGSFLNYEYKVKFNQSNNTTANRNKIKEIFKDDPTVRLRYPENSASSLRRVIDNFSQFLSLVSISAMLIAGIGIANTLLSFINQSNMSIAVKKALGFFSLNIKTIYYSQLLILLIFASIISYALSFLVVPLVDVYLSEGLGLSIKPLFSLTNFITVFLVGMMVLIIFSIPTINAIDQVKASNLFRNIFQNLQFYYSKKSVFASLLFLTALIMLFVIGSAKPLYSLVYFLVFFFCLIVFFLLSKFIIFSLKSLKNKLNIPLKVSIKNITQTKGITPITIMSLGLGVTLLLTLALVGTNFKREIAKSIPEIAPDYFFIGIQNPDRDLFESAIIKMDTGAKLEIVPLIATGIVKINGTDPRSYIKQDNNSYWVIGSDRRSSWSATIPEDNIITKGEWWDLTRPNKLQISLDSEVAKDFNIRLGDIFTLNIYGKEVDGIIVNFREVDYRDLSINFAMLFNPQFANTIPHEYLATAKFKDQTKFNEAILLETLPSISIIRIADYLTKITNILSQVYVAIILISAITIIIGLIVISSAIIVQGKIKEFQNLVFKILGFSKKEIVLSSIIEFILIFFSVILIAIFFAIISSYYIIENIFQLVWKLDLQILFNISGGIGLITLALIMLLNLRYLNPKVYPLIRNQ